MGGRDYYEKDFDSLEEAISFGQAKIKDYPSFEVEEIPSHFTIHTYDSLATANAHYKNADDIDDMAEDDEDMSGDVEAEMDSMFPEGEDSMEGFDWTLGD